ncbi:MAG: hypothetical protein ACE5F8_05805 [Woeseiaceae bacterium]
MKPLLVKAGFIALALFAAGNALADNKFGVGVKAGTLGFGLEGTWRPLPYLDLRLGANTLDYDRDDDYAGVNYDATLGLETFYATANFGFPVSPFRVTAGIYSNGNEVTMVSANNPSFDFGGSTFTPTEVGTLTGTTSFSSTAPYLGFGYDFTVMNRVGLNLDFGVLWQGDPSVTLVADGSLAGQPAFDAALEAERLELEDDLSNFKAWPVVSLGFVFNFF